MKTRVLGIILLFLGVVIGALGALPTGWFGRLNGVGDASQHLIADSVVGIGVLALVVGLSMLLRRESLRPGGRGDWTGLASKTAWDWLQLLIVPAVLAGLVAWFNFIQTQISIQASQKQQETDFRIAADQQAEDVLVTFEGDISNLLLRDNLRSSKTGDAVRVVARARTLTALRRLDSNRKGDLIRFLYEAQLLTTGAADNPIIDLAGADLEGARLAGADLSSASLRYAVLTRADLSGALLAGADLTGADLDGARLDGANLTGAVVGSKQLAQAQSLQGATLPDGSKHP